jgi:glycerate kinase
MVCKLDRNLAHFAKVIRRDVGIEVEKVPGAGAAGGLGAGLVAFLNGRLTPGVDIVMDVVELEKKICGCDLVITGEGRLDGQTVFGKAPIGVARAAKKFGIPVLAICGSLGPDARRVINAGIDACFACLEEPVSEEDLSARAAPMLTRCAEQVARLFRMGVLSAG